MGPKVLCTARTSSLKLRWKDARLSPRTPIRRWFSPPLPFAHPPFPDPCRRCRSLRHRYHSSSKSCCCCCFCFCCRCCCNRSCRHRCCHRCRSTQRPCCKKGTPQDLDINMHEVSYATVHSVDHHPHSLIPFALYSDDAGKLIMDRVPAVSERRLHPDFRQPAQHPFWTSRNVRRTILGSVQPSNSTTPSTLLKHHMTGSLSQPEHPCIHGASKILSRTRPSFLEETIGVART